MWARDILDGVRPAFDGYRAPTEHPLLFPFALALAPLGDLGLRVFVALTAASFVALVAATYRLGLRAAGVLGGLVAAALIGSRLNFPFFAAIGYLDLPYCALIAWAAALEVERPRRGGAVWVLLTLAGLLRPEGWLIAGLYARADGPARDLERPRPRGGAGGDRPGGVGGGRPRGDGRPAVLPRPTRTPTPRRCSANAICGRSRG